MERSSKMHENDCSVFNNSRDQFLPVPISFLFNFVDFIRHMAIALRLLLVTVTVVSVTVGYHPTKTVTSKS